MQSRPPSQGPGHRTPEQKAHDALVGREVEQLAALRLMQEGLCVQKIAHWTYTTTPNCPAAFFDYSDTCEGEGWDWVASVDLLVTGHTAFMAEIKAKPSKGHGAGRFYYFDKDRLNRLAKSFDLTPQLQHVLLIFDARRIDPPAYGFFVADAVALEKGRSDFAGTRDGKAYRIPVSYFTPLNKFIETLTKEETHEGVQTSNGPRRKDDDCGGTSAGKRKPPQCGPIPANAPVALQPTDKEARTGSQH